MIFLKGFIVVFFRLTLSFTVYPVGNLTRPFNVTFLSSFYTEAVRPASQLSVVFISIEE